MNKRRSLALWIFLAITGIPTLLYVGALLFDPGRTLVLWERAPFDIYRVTPLAIGLCLYAAIALFILRRVGTTLTGRQTAALLLWVFLAGCILEVAAVYIIESYPLRGILLRTFSTLDDGYWGVGTRVQNVGEFLATYSQTMSSFPVHPQRHPPGLPLVFWLLTLLSENARGLSGIVGPWVRPLSCFDDQAAWLNNAQLTAGFLGALLETVGALIVVVPLYALVRRLASVRAAAAAALLYVLTSGTLVWVSQFDRSFAAISITGLWLCEKLVNDRRHTRFIALLLGVCLSAGTFLSFGNVPIILLCALYAAVRVWQREGLTGWRERAMQALLVLGGIASIWVVCALVFHFDPIGTYRVGMGLQYQVDRPYWPFVVWHAWDILTFVGLPLAAVALFLMWKRSPALSLALAGTLVILCLLHVARGETGRVWLYFTPLIVALAAIYLSEHSPAHRQWVIGLVVLQMVFHIGLLRTIAYGVDPATVMDATLPQTLVPTDIRYGRQGEMQLLGYTLDSSDESTSTVKPGDVTAITFYWKLNGSEPISSSYHVFIHIADTLDDQYRIANHDNMPMNWKLPTSCWRPGQIVRDQHDVEVASDARPDSYVVLVGVYDHTHQRAFIERAQRAKNNAVELPGKFVVVARKPS